MSAEQRVAEAVRAAVDAVPVSAPPPSAIRARAGRAARARAGRAARAGATRGWAPILAAAAVVALAGLTVVVPTVTQHSAAPAPERPRTVLPTEIAGLSLLTAKVSAAPPGRAVALFHQGSFGMTIGFAQVVVLGADGKTYRRLDLAEERGATGDDGEWHAAEALLSPDGLRVAVTDSVRDTTTVDVVDLVSGRSQAVELPTASAVRPLAWTPDGERLLVTRQEPGVEDGSAPPVKVSLIDVRRGAVRDLAVPGRTDPEAAWRAAVAENGRTAFVSDGSTDGLLHLVSLESGAVTNTLPLGARQELAADSAMAPNERYLAVVGWSAGAQTLSIVEFGSEGLLPPGPVASIDLPESARFLGWLGSGTVVVATEGGDGEIRIIPIDGAGRPSTLTRFAAGGLQRVSGLQLALDGPGRLTSADVGGPDRGPWPWWFRITLGALVLVVLGLAGRWWRRRRAG